MIPSFTIEGIKRAGNSGYAVTVAATNEDGTEAWRRQYLVQSKHAQGLNEALQAATEGWRKENPDLATELGDKLTATVQGWISAGMAKARALFGTKGE
jgi:outer membrane usher protein FimD/PapC